MLVHIASDGKLGEEQGTRLFNYYLGMFAIFAMCKQQALNSVCFVSVFTVRLLVRCTCCQTTGCAPYVLVVGVQRLEGGGSVGGQ